MRENIPEFLWNLLTEQYGEELAEKITDGYVAERAVTLRVNRLKATPEEIKTQLSQVGIAYEAVDWSEDALIICGAREEAVRQIPAYEDGGIYLQSLSSMMPPLCLNPQPKECILDMAAAPGGKTTQMAALSGNLAQITACEKNKVRSERLRYNLEKQGASCAFVMVEDARKLDDFFSFDKILLDAPCSGSGTLAVGEHGITSKYTKELITRSAKTQEELLKKAIKLLKPGHEMIYSTCSILELENEKSLKKVLGKQAEIVPLDQAMFPGVTYLPVKIPGTLCVCPDELYEGFFVAKIRKN